MLEVQDMYFEVGIQELEENNLFCCLTKLRDLNSRQKFFRVILAITTFLYLLQLICYETL